MRTKYRIYGMIVCFIMIIFSFMLGAYYPYYPITISTAYFLMGLSAGYALRESLEKNKEKE